MPTPPIHYIVTGATGFLGRHVVARLISRGASVHILVRNESKVAAIPQLNGAKVLVGDINSPQQIPQLPSHSILIHCAWGHVRDMTNPIHHQQTEQHYAFIQEMVKRGIHRILVTGTLSEYGLQYGPMNPSQATRPNTSYAIAKDTLHNKLRELQSANMHIKLIWTRVFYLYGEGQDPSCIVPMFDAALARGDKTFAMSLGEQLLDYQDAEDAASQIIGLIGFENGVFNVGSGAPISLRRLLEQRMRLKNKTIEFNLGAYPFRETDSLAIWADAAPPQAPLP